MDYRLLPGLLLSILCYLHLWEIADAYGPLRVCVVKTAHLGKKVFHMCPTLVGYKEARCITMRDRMECLYLLRTKEAEFTLLNPEDMIASVGSREYTQYPIYEDNILVTHELRLFPKEEHHFEMVAIVNKNVANARDTRGKRFCHPGMQSVDEWRTAFSMYFGDWIIQKECDSNKTLLENRISALSTYFEAACIPGPWSADSTLDGKLKSKYRNLCALCDDPRSCYTNDKYFGQQGALLCLTDNVGDIAWVKLDEARVFFKFTGVDKKGYNYLCPDGSVRAITSEKPCIWISKPWPVVVARKDVLKAVNALMDDDSHGRKMLLSVMLPWEATPVSVGTPVTPEDFLHRFPGFMSATNRATCRPSRDVRWCVPSGKDNWNCRQLRQVSTAYGIEPSIFCVKQINRTSCLDAVVDRRADIFVAQPGDLLEARKKGVKPIVRVTSDKRQDLDRIAIVVKRDSRYRKFKDLRGARACFTGYKSVGWNAFVAKLRDVFPRSECSDAKAVGSFFSDSCVLGLPNEDEDVPSNLYSLCKQGKENNSSDDIITFDCLTSGLGDVAIVNLKTIERKFGKLNARNASKDGQGYRILCANDTAGEEENSCLLTWTTLGAVVAHENITNVRREEIYSMLVEMDKLFGKSKLDEWTPAFAFYEIDYGHYNIIFPEEAHHLEPNSTEMKGVKSYEEILEDIVKRPDCNVNTGHRYDSRYSITLFCIVITLLLCR